MSDTPDSRDTYAIHLPSGENSGPNSTAAISPMRNERHARVRARGLARRLQDLRHDQIVLERRERVRLAGAADDGDEV
jgi:hypothetical protein